MPFFGNILPTLRSYSEVEYGIYGKMTIGAQPFALGMNVPLRLGQLTGIPNTCHASANRQPQMDCLRSGSKLDNAAADFSYRK
jgi:hypothetical protein